MRVVFFCGYYSELAHEQIKRRTEDYWNAYFYVWGVKKGSHKRDFYILTPAKLSITKKNFHLVRETFGQWAAKQLPSFSKEPLSLVPIPSKDALAGKSSYRSLDMVQEMFSGTPHARSVMKGLRWREPAKKAHEGGSRKRADLLPLLQANPAVKGKRVILIDELFTTGGSLLASSDCLKAAGAKVLGAITCGKTIYDFETPAFGRV